MSTNQVLLRSLNTSIASSLPVIALLLIGAGLLGQITLREFAIALLVGMLTGAYSSLFIAAPFLGWLKSRSGAFKARRHRHQHHTAGGGYAEPPPHLTGDALRAVVVGGVGALRAKPASPIAPKGAAKAAPTPAPTTAAPARQLLSHPPRPRKKKRR